MGQVINYKIDYVLRNGVSRYTKNMNVNEWDVVGCPDSSGTVTGTMESEEYGLKVDYRDCEWVSLEGAWNNRREEAAKSQRAYRTQMALAATEKEKTRLRWERKNYVARRWYNEHKQEQRAKRRMSYRLKRNPGKTCCPVKMLGTDPAPAQAVTLWLTKCRTCHRIKYCHLGCDQEQRQGVYFRGRWFIDINPEPGTGTTFSEEIISLTRVY